MTIEEIAIENVTCENICSADVGVGPHWWLGAYAGAEVANG